MASDGSFKKDHTRITNSHIYIFGIIIIVVVTHLNHHFHVHHLYYYYWCVNFKMQAMNSAHFCPNYTERKQRWRNSVTLINTAMLFFKLHHTFFSSTISYFRYVTEWNAWDFICQKSHFVWSDNISLFEGWKGKKNRLKNKRKHNSCTEMAWVLLVLCLTIR